MLNEIVAVLILSCQPCQNNSGDINKTQNLELKISLESSCFLPDDDINIDIRISNPSNEDYWIYESLSDALTISYDLDKEGSPDFSYKYKENACPIGEYANFGIGDYFYMQSGAYFGQIIRLNDDCYTKLETGKYKVQVTYKIKNWHVERLKMADEELYEIFRGQIYRKRLVSNKIDFEVSNICHQR